VLAIIGRECISAEGAVHCVQEVFGDTRRGIEGRGWVEFDEVAYGVLYWGYKTVQFC
jgi:hypothetical protein